MSNILDKLEGFLKEEKKDDGVKSKLIKFFTENPSPKDDEIHALADELGIEHDVLEGHIYSLLGTLLTNVGLHHDMEDSEFDAQELEWGITIEHEHTAEAAIAKEIAKDHLAEIPDYYTRLIKMEKEAGVEDPLGD